MRVAHCVTLFQRHRKIAVLLADEAHEAGEHELGTPVPHAHGALERQELRGVASQDRGGNLLAHCGTGSETSRSDCVAIRT
jgi:hypothetical protein